MPGRPRDRPPGGRPRGGGTAVLVGMPPADARLELDPLAFSNHEKTLTGSVYGSEPPARALPRLVRLVSDGRLNLASLVGPSYSLDDVDAAFAESLGGSPGRVLRRTLTVTSGGKLNTRWGYATLVGVETIHGQRVEAHETHGGHAGQSLNGLAVSATVHCLTGCVIGEIAGIAIGTALGWGNLPTIALAIGLAYLFGFALTSRPLVHAKLPPGTIVATALAADTVSITIMEAIDNGFVLVVPGAMEAGLGDWLLWATVLGGFVIAFPFAFLANRYMIARGKGHAVVHQYH